MSRSSAVVAFLEGNPTTDSYWRSIVLFGNNVASYKFALAGALLEEASGREFVTLEELAVPFSQRITAHLQAHDKQGTSPNSRFLDLCRDFNRGEITPDALREGTARLGFVNVIDAFHFVDGREVDLRFFIDERSTGDGIRITDATRQLAADAATTLDLEVEARWRLVETAWELNLPRSLLTVDYDKDQETLIAHRRRVRIAGARDALNGYQKGHCFYCYRTIALSPTSPDFCHVDHVFAWAIGDFVAGAPINGAWNLVLACQHCNNWHEKSDRPPDFSYVERLHRRNEYLIASHHPLRPTLIEQTGETPQLRRSLLQAAHAEASVKGARSPWSTLETGPAPF